MGIRKLRKVAALSVLLLFCLCGGAWAQNVIFVAPEGGDFTSPVAAVSAITDASEDNPYLVKILPGVYDIGSCCVVMKPYVDIEGSGEEVTTIKGNAEGSLRCVVKGTDHAGLRSLTVIKNGGLEGEDSSAIVNVDAGPTIAHVTIFASGGSNNMAVYNDDAEGSNPTIMDDVAIWVGEGITNYGIINKGYSAPVLREIIIRINGDNTPNFGIFNKDYASPVISDAYINAWGLYGVGIHNREHASAEVSEAEIYGGRYALSLNKSSSIFVKHSELDGQNRFAPGTVHRCASVFDENFHELNLYCK